MSGDLNLIDKPVFITKCPGLYIFTSRCCFEVSNLHHPLLIVPTSRLRKDAPSPLAALMEVHHWEVAVVTAVVEVVISTTQMIDPIHLLSI